MGNDLSQDIGDLELKYNSLTDMFMNSIDLYCDHIAFECEGKKLTYKQVGAQARNLAAFFQNVLDLQKGDSIALMTPNGPAYPITVIAAHMCGLIIANVNPLYTPRELSHQLNDAKAKTLVVYGPISETYACVIEETNVDTVVAIGEEDFLVDSPKEPEVHQGIDNPLWMMKAVQDGQDLPFAEVSLASTDLAFLQYTGGTTGPSKGAMLSHGNILSNIAQVHKAWEQRLDPGEEMVVTALPLYHIFALTANFFLFFSIGGHNILIPSPRDMDGFMKALQGKKFTAMTGVNTLFAGLPNVEAFQKLDFERLDICVGGGAAIIDTVAAKWKEVTGTTICQAYGLSETSPVLTSNDITKDAFRDSVGQPMPWTEIKLLNDDGEEVPHGEAGELCARGPQVMQGYWGREDATKESMSEDGFFKTGDIAVKADDGFFKIVDRKKDMVLVSGFNVFPNEIEAIITGHPSVLEVACIGIPDKKTGEALKAFIVLNDCSSGLTESDIREFCRENLTAYKVPRYVVFVDELPKSTVGKILRRELRAQELDK